MGAGGGGEGADAKVRTVSFKPGERPRARHRRRWARRASPRLRASGGGCKLRQLPKGRALGISPTSRRCARF